MLTNIRQFGTFEIILLFQELDFTVPGYFREKYPECSIFVYTDMRLDRSYIPSIKPHLLWQFFKEDPSRENEQYFYIDSDLIFREWPDFSKLGASKDTWVSSDCSGYIGYEYINSREKGPEIASKLAEICGITLDRLKNAPGAGAQWVITNPTAAFWERVYDDSMAIHHYFQPLDSNIQKWTAEMWAQLFGTIREGKKVKIHKELDFIRPTDDVAEWDKVKILHNAGVLGSEEMFYKGKYVDVLPFGEDFSYVNPKKASIKYVQAIEKVVR